MLGFRPDFEERETSARRTIPKRRQFSATTDPHLRQRLAASLDQMPAPAEMSRLAGIAMGLRQALNASAPELRHRA